MEHACLIAADGDFFQPITQDSPIARRELINGVQLAGHQATDNFLRTGEVFSEVINGPGWRLA